MRRSDIDARYQSGPHATVRNSLRGSKLWEHARKDHTDSVFPEDTDEAEIKEPLLSRAYVIHHVAIGAHRHRPGAS